MTTTTLVQKGQHKDLSDIVKNIDPHNTPFTSSIGEEKIGNKVHHWTEEKYDPVVVNAQVEGADAPASHDNVLTERQNATQIFAKTISLSTTAQATQLAGNVQTMAHQTQLKLTSQKRDIESAFLGGSTMKLGTGSAAGNLASYQAQIESDFIHDAASGAVTEDEINGLLADLMSGGGNPSILMAHPRLIQTVAKVLQATLTTRDAGDKDRISKRVTTYISNVGEVRLVSNPFAKYNKTTKVGDIFVYDPSLWAMGVLDPVTMSDLAKTGLSDNKQIHTEITLINKNYSGSGLITNAKAA